MKNKQKKRSVHADASALFGYRDIQIYIQIQKIQKRYIGASLFGYRVKQIYTDI